MATSSLDSLQILYVARILWGVATACVRLSILSLYYRLLKRMGARSRHFWVLHVMTGLTVMFLLDMIIGGSIPCLYVDLSDIELPSLTTEIGLCMHTGITRACC